MIQEKQRSDINRTVNRQQKSWVWTESLFIFVSIFFSNLQGWEMTSQHSSAVWVPAFVFTNSNNPVDCIYSNQGVRHNNYRVGCTFDEKLRKISSSGTRHQYRSSLQNGLPIWNTEKESLSCMQEIRVNLELVRNVSL